MRKSFLMIAVLAIAMDFCLSLGSKALLNAPNLVSPKDSATSQPIPLGMRWRSVAGALSYELEIAADSDFSTILLDNFRLSDTSSQVGDSILQRETIYYWRVRAKNASTTSNWSTARFFETVVSPPPQPQLISPSDGVIGISTNPVFHWNGGGTDVTYRVQVSFDASFSSPVYDKSGITADSQQISPALTHDTLYYWRVNASNPGGTSQWSLTRAFITRTASGLPRAPRLITPVNGAINQPTSILFYWNAISGATIYELQISLKSDFSVLSFDNPGIFGISQQIDLPRNDTTYYWRVRGYDLISEWSSTWRFRTLPEIPSPPVLQSPLNGSVNQPQVVKLFWNGSSQALTYEVQVAATLSFFPLIVDSVLVNKDTLTIGPLAFNSGFFWRVRGNNAAGWGDYSSSWNFSIVAGIAPVATTLPSQNIGFNSVKLMASVIPNVNTTDSTRVIFQYGLTTSYGITADASPAIVRGTRLDTVNSVLSTLTPNTTYHYRVLATNKFGISQGADQVFTTILPPYPDTSKVKTTVNFPSYASSSDYKATDYRLIGLPGASNMLMSSFLKGSQNSDWQLYWDNGASSNGIIPFDGTPTFKATVGKAFWFIHRGAWSIDTSYASASLDTTRSVSIPLHSGWNLITNPYSSSIHWSVLRSIDSLAQPLYAYTNGSFDTTTEFQPYVGYYFFNAKNFSALKVPYVSIYQQARATSLLPKMDWTIQITASSGKLKDGISWIGTSRELLQQGAAQNFHKPGGFVSALQVVFNRPEWDASYSSFATDIRPLVDRLETWTFDVLSTAKVPVVLSFTGIMDVPSRFQVYLINRTRGTVTDLRKTSENSFTPDGTTSKFEIVIGEADALQEILNGVSMPREFSFGRNYPNPFNPQTSIPVEIPMSSIVSLRIYNILGQEVRTLHEGNLEAGFYSFDWNGQDNAGKSMPSGVYFCRMDSPMAKSLTQKMLMIK
jgi:hypothetical protein